MSIYTPIDKLVDDLAKPIFVLRMASKDNRQSARTREANARFQIRQIVLEYVRSYALDDLQKA